MSKAAENSQSSSTVPAPESAHGPHGSSPPRPVNPPPPTYWPFVTAVGLMICFWGIELDVLVVCVGGGIFLIGILGLIGDWVREHRNESI